MAAIVGCVQGQDPLTNERGHYPQDMFQYVLKERSTDRHIRSKVLGGIRGRRSIALVGREHVGEPWGCFEDVRDENRVRV
jgi:hypothetical protein